MSEDLVRLGIASTNMVPNQPSLDAGPLFMKAVAYAQTHSIATVIADPGKYYFLSSFQNTHVAVGQINNMTIDLQGSDLIFTHPQFYGIVIYPSTNVVLQNFTVDYQPLPFTQVQVTAVDLANSQIQYAVQPGWPDPSIFNSMVDYSGATASLVEVHIFRNGQLAPGVSLIDTQLPFSGGRFSAANTLQGSLAAVRRGDVAVLTIRGGGGDAVALVRCAVCNVRNITIYSTGGGAWGVSAFPTHSSVFERIYMIPKPGTDRLISAFTPVGFTTDGPSNQVRLSRAIRTVDDGFAPGAMIVGTVQNQSGARTVTVAGTGGVSFLGSGESVPNGTPISFQRLSDGAILAAAVVVSQTALTSTQPAQATYTFDRDLPANLTGTILLPTDPNLNGANSIIERNTVQDQAMSGRGLNMAGLADTTVRGNFFWRTAYSAIHGEQSTAPGEGASASLANLTIANNVIDGASSTNNWWWFELGGIQMVTINLSYTLMTTSPHANITVANNFIADPGRSAVFIANTTGGNVRGNYLLDPNKRPDLPNAFPTYYADALLPLVIDTTSSGITTTNNTIDTTSGRMFVTDTQYNELAAYAPGGIMRLNAYNIGALASPAVTLTDADGNTAPLTIQNTASQAIDVQLPAAAALGGAYVTLTSGGAKYFGTLFIDNQDNIPAVNGCTYETSVSSSSVRGEVSSVPILVVTQAGCSYQVSATDPFVNPGTSKTGTAVIPVGFALNDGTPRTTIIEIAGQPITLTQGNACDVDNSGTSNIGDVQAMIDEALGANSAMNDLNRDGVVNVVDVQTVTRAVLGSGCAAS